MIAPPRPYVIAPEREPIVEREPETPAAVTEVPARRRARIDDDARPTLARPSLAATGLFQGWGPRLR